MSSRGRILSLAFGAGLLAALTAYFWLQSLTAPPRTKKEAATVTVVVPRQDIPPRTLITEDLVEIRQVPVDKAAPDAMRSPSEVIGKVSTTPITKGLPLTAQTLAPRSIDMGMAFALPPSSRAVAIALDPVSAVAGFIKPGDHVDILGTFRGDQGRSITCVVLQNITLLATGSRAMQGASPPAAEEGAVKPAAGGDAAKPEEVPTATVMVTPAEAQILVLAAASGRLQLALRAPNDNTRSTMPGLPSTFFTRGSGALRGGGTPPVSSPARPVARRQDPAVTLPPQKETAPSPAPPVSAPRPQKPPVEFTLAGVLLGEEGFAMITSGDHVWYKKIGDQVARYRIRNLTEDGIVVHGRGRRSETWHIGESRLVTE